MYKGAAQLRQEVKQKAKRDVEKAFLGFSVPQTSSHPGDAKSRLEEYRRISEALIKFYRQNDLFHHGKLPTPDPNVDPSVRCPSPVMMYVS